MIALHSYNNYDLFFSPLRIVVAFFSFSLTRLFSNSLHSFPYKEYLSLIYQRLF